MPSGISFVKVINRSGPNTDPWGTPEIISLHSEV